jgi:hypothetical protein
MRSQPNLTQRASDWLRQDQDNGGRTAQAGRRGCGTGDGDVTYDHRSEADNVSVLEFRVPIHRKFEAMTNRIPGFIKLALWTAIVAFGFAAAPASAQTQQTMGATENAQSTQPQQTAGQDKDKKDEKKDAKKDDKKDDPDNPKNDRIFLVVPNYATVEHPTANITPLTMKQKFKLGAEDSFDTYSIPLAMVVAAMAQARNDDPSWGQGWGAFGKRFASSYGDTVIGSFMTTGVFPSLLREDPRYFRRGTGTKRSRSVYALKRIFVIRSDSGRTEFNFSEFGGNAAAAGLSLLYHTKDERNFSSFASDYAQQIAIDVVANQLKEFWPDIRHKIFKK